MAWVPLGSINVTEDYQASPISYNSSAPYYRLIFNTPFPSRHRLLLGTAFDASLQETTPVELVYPSPNPIVLIPITPMYWNGQFCYFVRSLRWGNSLPPLTIDIAYRFP